MFYLSIGKWNLPSNVTGLLHYTVAIVDYASGLIIDYFAIFVALPGGIILSERRFSVGNRNGETKYGKWRIR